MMMMMMVGLKKEKGRKNYENLTSFIKPKKIKKWQQKKKKKMIINYYGKVFGKTINIKSYCRERKKKLMPFAKPGIQLKIH